jgi:FlaA1/EpsC-like NDP-sugar epimerase
MLIEELSALVTGRSDSMFAGDIEARREEIEQAIGGKRVLAIGGAGSVGAATVQALAPFRPDSLHVVDQNENNLAELVRDLRSSVDRFEVPDFRTLPLDFGSAVMERFLKDQPPYDYVLNFAAVKHVRSEKDIYSLLHMLNTNVLKAARLLDWLAERGGTNAYFCVSTDKAANPVNLMGASKRLMEHVALSADVVSGFEARVTSARFANVAFSEGSLLQGFLKRLEKGQALAAPAETRRFFISPREAGQICLLAAVRAPARHLLIPRLDPAEDLHDLETVAVAVLRHRGLEPHIYHDEIEARVGVQSDLAEGRYPLLLTPLDTSGEKPYEEFVGEGELAVELGLSSILGVPYSPLPAGKLATFLGRIEELVSRADRAISKEEIVNEISAVIPELQHIDSEKDLDQRM